MTSDSNYQVALFDEPAAAFRLERLPMPDLRPGETLVRVSCCTLCGSDLHTWHGRRDAPVPLVLGHEAIGVVDDLCLADGPVTDYLGTPIQCGDRITWSIVVSCGRCRLCLSGLPQKCEHLFKYGHERHLSGAGASGGLSQYCVLRRGTAIFRVPENLPDKVGAIANCAGATVEAALRTAGSVSGAAVLVQGAGMLGLVAAAAASTRGACVLLSDPDPSRTRRAHEFGVTHVLDCNPEVPSMREQVRRLTAGRGINVALEFSGNPAAVEAAIPALAPGAHYVIAGAVFPSRPAGVNMEAIVRGMIQLSGIHNYTPEDLGHALRFLALHHSRYPFESLIEGHFDLSGVTEAFTWAEKERPARIAVFPNP